MTERLNIIGSRIRNLRIARGIQQGELSQAISMNQSVLNRIEKGTRPARDIEIAAIATFFHVSADWLLHLTEDDDASRASFAPDDETPMIPMTAEEEALLRRFRRLDERGRTALSLVAELADKAKG